MGETRCLGSSDHLEIKGTLYKMGQNERKVRRSRGQITQELKCISKMLNFYSVIQGCSMTFVIMARERVPFQNSSQMMYLYILPPPLFPPYFKKFHFHDVDLHNWNAAENSSRMWLLQP